MNGEAVFVVMVIPNKNHLVSEIQIFDLNKVENIGEFEIRG